ncbi:hypothetical protein ACQU0X_09835 [Pseudovibrio ascidiaceicola]|jgi:TPR repeat protein|uniref:Sel1 repeat family protein n=1 Tax=Pseudovibrio ascidiaceicola TaxID=285279 RepID=A0A1I4EUM9_9HYPH|nr:MULTISPECIES: hypothetical protein [Pseudovibrio]KZL05814.1 hypothetical protein PsAD26_03955 [Pseudovibrio sp. Ad26]KZL15308.1 hypothetical protein PsAD37_04317 [Pseudovibrio sp. Ad37]KZL23992.1 hypothetical protein PsWM33_02947 [Pseudovibrio sp. WM33]SFL07851.1 hypothetical protein SAMN04488518_1161 [Pseudovibrio ascidiaceicola]
MTVLQFDGVIHRHVKQNICEVESLLRRGLDAASGKAGACDLIEAHKWFNLAAMRGSTQAVRYRREVSQEMSNMEIAEAQRAARDWLSVH